MAARTRLLSIGPLALALLCCLLAGCDRASEEELRAARDEADGLRGEVASLESAQSASAEALAAAERRIERLDYDLSMLQDRLRAAGAQAAQVPEPAEPPEPEEAPAAAPTSEPDPEVAEVREHLSAVGALLFERGDLVVAHTLSLAAVRLGSDGPADLYRVAYCKAAAGQYGEAAEWYDRALAPLRAQAEPDVELMKKCLLNGGVARFRLGQTAEAVARYEEALALDGAYAPAHFNLGVAYADRLGRPEDAIEAFRRHIVYGGGRGVAARDRILKLQEAAGGSGEGAGVP